MIPEARTVRASEWPHKHVWHMSPPEGPESRGVCLCGEERMFPNFSPENSTYYAPRKKGKK